MDTPACLVLAFTCVGPCDAPVGRAEAGAGGDIAVVDDPALSELVTLPGSLTTFGDDDAAGFDVRPGVAPDVGVPAEGAGVPPDGVGVSIVTFGTFTVGVVTLGTVTAGVVTVGVVTFGIATAGAVTVGVVSLGTVTVRVVTVTFGIVTAAVLTEGTLRLEAAALSRLVMPPTQPRMARPATTAADRR